MSGECEEQEEAETDIADIVRVHAVSPSVPRSYKVSLEINKIPITMELDTGASVSLVSEATWTDKTTVTTLHFISAKLPKQKPESAGAVTGGGQCAWEGSQPTAHCG